LAAAKGRAMLFMIETLFSVKFKHFCPIPQSKYALFIDHGPDRNTL
jgi:hypothetical protein